MKTLSLALLFLLAAGFWTEALCNPFDINDHRGCCYPQDFRKKEVPSRRIKNYTSTAKTCPRKAIILELKNGSRRCADPNTPWVKKYMESIRTEKA